MAPLEQRRWVVRSAQMHHEMFSIYKNISYLHPPPSYFLDNVPTRLPLLRHSSMSGWGVANRLQSVTRRLRHQTHPRCWIYSRINQIWKKGSLKGRRRRRRRMEYGIDGAMSRARSGALRTFSPDASLSLSLSASSIYYFYREMI